MAWHLRYTSAATGPTGRSGFQFVAVTPGAPNELAGSVAPYMSYRPPPSAPLAPAPDELDRFPVALAYDRVGEHGLLVCCRYTGKDYSGRYGNFLGHAVVATQAEMEGLRPIEFWRSSMWADGGPEDLVPGDVLDPELLAEWLAGRDDDELLAALVDAVGVALHNGHGRIVLISADVELIARWIAVVSYSLPLRLAAQLSFVTYAADPDAAPQYLVGTTPDSWTPAAGETCFRLDEPYRPGLEPTDADPTGLGGRPSGVDGPGRFGRLIAGCWRAAELGGIDEIGELAALAGDLRAAAALASLCGGDETVSEAEEISVAALVRDEGGAVPGWVWHGLLAAVPRLRLELAAALWESAADAELTDRCAERCVELVLAEPGHLDRLPAGLRCPGGMSPAFDAAIADADDLVALARITVLADRLGGALDPGTLAAAAADLARDGGRDLLDSSAAGREDRRGGSRAPTDSKSPRQSSRPGETGRRALEVVAGPWREAFSTGVIDGLVAADRLAELWEGPPEAGECARLIRRLRPDQHAATHRVVLAAFGAVPLDDPETMGLAELVVASPSFVDTEVREAAELVLDHERALRATEPVLVARLLASIAEFDSGDSASAGVGVVRELGKGGFASISADLTRRGPRAQADVAAAAEPPVRARLVGDWLATGDRADLAELAVRMRWSGASDPALDDWARELAGKRFGRRHLQSTLADRDPRLADGWRELAGDRRQGDG